MALDGGVAKGPQVLVLSEDGWETSVPTIQALARKMCTQILASLDPARLRFMPPPEGARHAMSGNKWKSTKQADEVSIRRLVRLIAEQLAIPSGFVIFHFDGDRPYARRQEAENPIEFQRKIAGRVAQHLRSKDRTSEQVDEMMAKLLRFTPYYCIEAWTYYNTRVLRDLCQPHEVSTLDQWDQNPGATEELVPPHDAISAGKRHNRRLAEEQFPAKVALAAGKSFADTVTALRGNAALIAALRPLTHAARYHDDGSAGDP